MKVIIQYTFISVLFSCSTKYMNKDMARCDLRKAEMTAGDFLVKKGYNLEALAKSTIALDSTYLIEFELKKESNLIGGGAKIVISKETCKIVETILYQ